MRTLEFEVSAQRIKKKDGCDFTGLVAGSEGYLQASFTFSPEWDKCKKAASFWIKDVTSGDFLEYGALLDKNNCCLIPKEALVTDSFYVSVTGIRGSDYKIVTTKKRVRQEGI